MADEGMITQSDLVVTSLLSQYKEKHSGVNL